MDESQIRDRYGIPADAYLPRSAIEIHKLAALLYAAWRSFECKKSIQPAVGEFAPPQFFHIATELCSMAWRDFQSVEHILWPKQPERKS